MPLNDARLTRLRNDIVACIHPDQIWLFSRKEGLDGRLSSVKLCVVVPEGDSRKAEHTLYLEVDSELPFDLVCYNREQWDALTGNPDSFAYRVRSSGRLLYEN